MEKWKLRDAKSRFREVVDRALRDGPQIVTRRGEDTVVVIAYRDFVCGGPTQDFKAFLTSVPLADLDLERS